MNQKSKQFPSEIASIGIKSLGEVRDIIAESMKRVNEELKLNVEIKCSADFGRTYKEVH